MRTIIQRVSHASVTIDGQLKAAIQNGMLILVGVCNEDNQEDIDWLVKKITHLRIFDDENGVMNRSIMDINGDMLIVSQFTLYASCKKGNRPSYIHASKPDIAIPLYENFCQKMSAELGKQVKTGEFGANMQVELLNDGPVTISMDSKIKE